MEQSAPATAPDQEAAEIAELRKEDYGGSYTIEGGRNDGERT